jgi:hypothetical protein
MYQDILSRKREKCEAFTDAHGRKDTTITQMSLSFLFHWGLEHIPFSIIFFSLNRGRDREPVNSNSLNMLYVDSKRLKVTITRIFII